MFVDFFGRAASTYKSIGLVAMQYEIPVVIGYARRLNDRFHFKVGAQDIIYPKDWKNEDDPLRYITQPAYTAAIEQIGPCAKTPGNIGGSTDGWKNPAKRGKRPRRLIEQKTAPLDVGEILREGKCVTLFEDEPTRS